MTCLYLLMATNFQMKNSNIHSQYIAGMNHGINNNPDTEIKISKESICDNNLIESSYDAWKYMPERIYRKRYLDI